MSKKTATEKSLVLITVADACGLLQISRRTLYRMIVAGAIPAPQKIGRFRQSYFDMHAFDRACRAALA